MQWHEGHAWCLDIRLPVVAGPVNFKIIMQDQAGHVRWEEGPDRTITLQQTATCTASDISSLPAPSPAAPTSTSIVVCEWGSTQLTALGVQLDVHACRRQLCAVESRVAAVREKQRRRPKPAILLDEEDHLDDAAAPLQGSTRGLLGSSKDHEEPSIHPGSRASSSTQLQQIPLINLWDMGAHNDAATQLSQLMGTASKGMGGEWASAVALFGTQARHGWQPEGSSSRTVPCTFEESVAADCLGLDNAPLETLSERVLSATVDKLMAAAQQAVDREQGVHLVPNSMLLQDLGQQSRQAAALLIELEVRGCERLTNFCMQSVAYVVVFM